MNINDLITVGDVIQIKGPSIPVECQHAYFRIMEVGENVILSRPYNDVECTVPFRRAVSGDERTESE